MADNDKNKSRQADQQAAIELIRKKVETAYGHEPQLEAEAETVKIVAPTVKLSAHQKYAQDLIKADMPLAEMHAAWHRYYSELSDAEKHEVWQEFYQAHGQTEHYQAYATAGSQMRRERRPSARTKQVARKLQTAAQTSSRKPNQKLHSLFVGLSTGAVAVLIVMFGLFNERFIAPFIQPSRAITTTPLISEGTVVDTKPEVIIPKINVEIPVVYGLTTIDEGAIQTALQDGVVHYADTAVPGQNGNVVIVGHSSNNIFNRGKYKFAFVLLSRLESGDTFYLQKDGKRYTYQIYEKRIVDANDISVLAPQGKPATAALITCDPPGTSLKRLVVFGEQIDPDPGANSAALEVNQANQTKSIPGNAPSLWSRFWGWLTD